MRILLTIFLVTISYCCLANSQKIISSKTETCQHVFDKLKAAKGLLPTQAPHFHLVRNLPNQNLAIAMALNEDIYLEEATFDLCKEMGQDSLSALAFILSHELSHYTRKHGERHRFLEQDKHRKDKELAMAFSSGMAEKETQLAQVSEINRKYRIRQNEAEADLDAGFMSYLAGYRSLTAGADFLARAYKKFNLDASGGNYASLAERQEIVQSATLKLDTLVGIFEAANYAMLTGEMEFADIGYQYISEFYQSPKLYNNLGVSEIISHCKGKDDKEIPYGLPLTLELETYQRLDYSLGSGAPTREAVLNEYNNYLDTKAKMDRAISNFEKAIQLNPRYATPRLNLAIAYYLRHKIHVQYSHLAYYMGKYELPYIYGVQQKHLQEDLNYAASASLDFRHNIYETDSTDTKALSDCYNMMAIIAHMQTDTAQALVHINESLRIAPTNTAAERTKQAIEGTIKYNQYLMIPELTEDEKPEDEKPEEIVYRTWHPYEVFSPEALDTILNLESPTWEVRLDLAKEKKMIPITTSVSYNRNSTPKKISWQKRKGKTKIISALDILKGVSAHNQALLKDLNIGSTIKDLFEKLGRSSISIETPKGTLYNYQFDPSYIGETPIQMGFITHIINDKIVELVYYRSQ